MSKLDQKALMNLPEDVKILLASGRSAIYRLPVKYAAKGAYLLAVSRDDTFFVSEEGKIGEKAGKLGSIEVEEVLRVDSGSSTYPSVKLNIA